MRSGLGRFVIVWDSAGRLWRLVEVATRRTIATATSKADLDDMRAWMEGGNDDAV